MLVYLLLITSLIYNYMYFEEIEMYSVTIGCMTHFVQLFVSLFLSVEETYVDETTILHLDVFQCTGL